MDRTSEKSAQPFAAGPGYSLFGSSPPAGAAGQQCVAVSGCCAGQIMYIGTEAGRGRAPGRGEAVQHASAPSLTRAASSGIASLRAPVQSFASWRPSAWGSRCTRQRADTRTPRTSDLHKISGLTCRTHLPDLRCHVPVEASLGDERQRLDRPGRWLDGATASP